MQTKLRVPLPRSSIAESQAARPIPKLWPNRQKEDGSGKTQLLAVLSYATNLRISMIIMRALVLWFNIHVPSPSRGHQICKGRPMRPIAVVDPSALVYLPMVQPLVTLMSAAYSMVIWIFRGRCSGPSSTYNNNLSFKRSQLFHPLRNRPRFSTKTWCQASQKTWIHSMWTTFKLTLEAPIFKNQASKRACRSQIKDGFWILGRAIVHLGVL